MNDRNLSDLAGAWLCREAELRLLASGQIAMRAAGSPAISQPANRGRVAVVPVAGVLSKSPSWWSSGVSYGDIRERTRIAAASPDVSSILLYIDSPGGSAAGVDEAAADIAAAAQQKPVYAFIEDLGASGAYYLASQATKIFANRSALVGSIGVFAVLVDSSKLAEKAGLAVHVVKAGEFKATSDIPGVAISADALKERQRIVDSIYDRFVGVVASGRQMSRKKAAGLADGRVHSAADAAKLGLIDGVSTLDAVFAQLQSGQPLGTSPAAAGNQVKGTKMDAKAEFDEAVVTYMEQHPRMSKVEAARAVLVADPELRERYVAEHNEQHREAVQGRRR